MPKKAKRRVQDHGLKSLVYDARPKPVRVRYFCDCGDKSDWFDAKELALEAHARHQELALVESKRAVQESLDRRS